MAGPIVSADGKLQIMRHSIVYPTMGPKSVQGAVKNLSSAAVNAEVIVELTNQEIR
jgi:hypothetical protein